MFAKDQSMLQIDKNVEKTVGLISLHISEKYELIKTPEKIFTSDGQLYIPLIPTTHIWYIHKTYGTYIWIELNELNIINVKLDIKVGTDETDVVIPYPDEYKQYMVFDGVEGVCEYLVGL